MSTFIPDDEGIDYSDLEAKYRVEPMEGLDTCVVVDGVPIIDEPRKERLLLKMGKEFERRGCPYEKEKVFIPWNESTGKSKGYVFIEFNTAEEAERAKAAMDKHPFDAKHRFQVNILTELDTYANMDETFREPEPEVFKPKEHLKAWLTDPKGRDQYATYRADDVTVFWHGKPASTEIAHERSLWTDLYVQWSPQGTLLASIHRQGVKLWGGPSFQLIQKFAHPLVKRLDFSPDEKYLVTYERISIPDNATQGPQFLGKKNEGDHVVVWDIRTGHLKRTFPRSVPVDEDEVTSKVLLWPQLKWSPDGKYVARITPGKHISVYSIPDFTLVDEKSIKIEGVVDFEWCPLGDKDREEAAAMKGQKKSKESVLAYWTPEIGNQPARAVLMSFPSRSQLRSKNLFNVAECKLYWQDSGDFLCVKVDRITKTKKPSSCNLEIFRLREKDIPVEVVEPKDTVIEFAWEPKGERFIIISTNDPNYGAGQVGVQIKTEVSFYQLDRSRNDFRLLKTLSSRYSNIIRWSPRGRHVLLATMGSSSKSDMEFWDMDFNNDDSGRKEASDKKEDWGSGMHQLATGEHYGVTDIEWDPSGRYISTSVSVWRHTVENGFAIWDFRGQEQQKHLIDRFKQFLWRPRPRTLLTKEEQKVVRKNLKEYSRVFDEEDAALESNVSAELIQARKRAVNEWNAWRARVRQELSQDPKRKRRTAQKKEEQKEEAVELIDELIEENITVLE
ncbi:Translation initiation factor 3 subunit b [Serendipita sp. 396]|nr:Translation initiation factor 3 subunit b [Serendipita sp. 396]KAG8788237.1 Translation initiation factor 3 subunit b [Serendipita sp. 397]KAG8803441.1 Translation initiation factor 3 subunit b [Serendipita sp. 398]KAG8827060.1 Translation initiation factor 3 subunit b [Serendipita sp. 401]KAG8838647.1 Translation initiation factor 3 subunit b [Serendipita sp. 400]KAG8860229.1 Translation initiation factor 3 subunit b [Serendipita sp. 411]KAG8874378.1 Translation initiation factor 3 subuni